MKWLREAQFAPGPTMWQTITEAARYWQVFEEMREPLRDMDFALNYWREACEPEWDVFV